MWEVDIIRRPDAARPNGSALSLPPLQWSIQDIITEAGKG